MNVLVIVVVVVLLLILLGYEVKLPASLGLFSAVDVLFVVVVI